MPKYLISASYSAEGLRGLQKDKASGRRQAVTAAVEGLGGRVECFYNALGADDVYVIVDLPDNSTAAAIGVTVSATGLVRTRTTALLTVEETDRALEKSINYRAPGRYEQTRRRLQSEGRTRLQPMPHDFLAGGEPDAGMRANVLQRRVEPGDTVRHADQIGCRQMAMTRPDCAPSA